MCNRKRRPLQPMLEPMEPRVVPSQMGLVARHDRLVASHVGQVNTSAKHPKVTQHSINAGLMHLQQQLALIQTRSKEHTPSAQETPAEKATTETSSLFKSIFASL
jgi:hypothetical protein